MIAAQHAPQQLNHHRKRPHARSTTAGSAAMQKTVKTSPSSSPSFSSSSRTTIANNTNSTITSTSTLGVKTPVVEPSPVKFLYNLFSKCEQGRRIISKISLSSTTWEKPSQEALDAYDLDLVQAIREGNIDALRRMLKEGKSMNACNKFGESILAMACRRGHVETVQFLVLEANVEINIRDDFGRLPHHDTCWTATLNEKIMDILLTASSSPELLVEKDVRGHTPFHYARREHWDDWVYFLEERSDQLLKALQQKDAPSSSNAK